MTTVIKVENLGKKYLIGHEKQARYSTLRDSLSHGVKSVANRLIHPFSTNAEETELEEFWALRDINFEIKQGDRVGIIGRNGAGKSTLLKILSRITAPTTGKITLKGRVASLLEVGTGFHPELSGRENIYLNGAILGMRKAEIKRKFDEIVAFAEVEKFLDTPVKRYSSGMYVRLAFAVAAHLEPEILIVDEVLAVGDAQFQKKCLGKMEEVGNEGRTVLFVSHNMPMITTLCSKAMLLQAGCLIRNDSVSDVIISYYENSSGISPASIDYSKIGKNIGDEYVKLISAKVENKDKKESLEFFINESICISVIYKILKFCDRKFIPVFDFYTSDGTYAFGVSSNKTIGVLPSGEYILSSVIPPNFLNEGVYFVGISIHSFENQTMHHVIEKSALMFNVKDVLTLRNYGYTGHVAGVIRPKFETTLSKI